MFGYFYKNSYALVYKGKSKSKEKFKNSEFLFAFM